MTYRIFGYPLLLLLTLLLAGCVVGPDYQRPEMDVPVAYKSDASWKEAEPKAALAKGAWWTVYGDPLLDDLEQQAIAANQDLRVALARLEQVRTGLRLSKADRFPDISLNGSATRSRTAPDFTMTGEGETGNVFSLPFYLGYEIDLWGRARRSVEAASADVEQAQADYQGILLSLQADVARTYFDLRALDNEILLLEQTLGLLEEALELVDSQYRNGQVSQLSLMQARTELAKTRAEAVALEKIRNELVNTLALLIGKPASEFTVPTKAHELKPPAIAAGLPSHLLERRPDIAAAERRMGATSARIGVAKTAFFPTISLTGSAGLSSGEVYSLFDWDNRTWGLGPAIYLPIFDAGRNSASLDRVRLVYEEAVAVYRQQVLQAFREVEDGLQGLDVLSRQAVLLEQAARSAGTAWELSGKRYQAGYVSYLEVIDTQRTALEIARALTRLQGQQMTTSVLLIKALGGGWQGV
ncbi:MAG: hypothetical protein C0618_02510 [Desulfuromonas sp.]|nr:MAG: hypothetical protein C0618_02510 [Desulfuromonas sp.]